jgi:arsenite methyltransferase
MNPKHERTTMSNTIDSMTPNDTDTDTAAKHTAADSTIHSIVQDYYGRQLQGTTDLKTSACCDVSSMPEWLKPLLSRIHPEVLSRYYGCGLVCPPLLEGCRVLDLGCGAGRDVYALAQLVGPTGSVVGVDMTDEQLAVARAHQAHQTDVFGYSNVEFLHGYIEQLDALGLEPGSFDVIVSNCVVNLSPDKDAVLAGVQRLLKPGGEFYFSDVYADRRVPLAVKNDPVLYGECLGGALYWNDFIRLAKRQGFADPRLVEDRPLEVTDPQLAGRIGNVRFYSATYRLFKLAALETACEDYGQAVIYKGSIASNTGRFVLDKHHDIQAGKVFPVCGNTWHMLAGTRLAPHFQFIGNFDTHYGIFEGCGSDLPFDQGSAALAGACC